MRSLGPGLLAAATARAQQVAEQHERVFAPKPYTPAPPRECRTILGMAIAGELRDIDTNRAFGRYEQAAYDEMLARGCVDDDGGITQTGRQVYAILGGGK